MKIGIFGVGHMGSAMVKGWVRAETLETKNIYVKGGSGKTAKSLQEDIPFTLVETVEEMSQADILFIATSPRIVEPVLKSLSDEVVEKQIPIVSVASGVDIPEMSDILGENYPIAHCIPNTPVEVNQGVLAISYSEGMDSSKKEVIDQALNPLGDLIEVDESLLGVCGSVAGCSPAFVDVFIEALSDAGVLYGLPRELSYTIIKQMIKGTAELAIQSEKHPGELKDGVTSPGGSTIKGIAALEKNGFRNAIIEALKETMS